LICSYRPDIPLDFIQEEMGFESRQELLQFLHDQKADQIKTSASDESQQSLDARIAVVALLDSVKKYKKIDIKGQV
jgi:hypothetical protein